MPPLHANLDASCFDIHTSLPIICFTVDDLQRVDRRHAFNFGPTVPEGKQNALRKWLLVNLELIFGLGKDGRLTDEPSKNLVSSAATRARVIGRCAGGEERSEGCACCSCEFGYGVVDEMSKGRQW